MQASTADFIFCPSCGKKYAWKPDLGGKKVRCKCGEVIAVPADPPSASPAKPPVEDDLYDFAADAPVAPPPRRVQSAQTPAAAPISIPGMEDDLYRCPSCSQSMNPGAIICSHCGFNLKTGEKSATPRRTTVAATGATTAPPSPAAAFSAFAPRNKPQIVEDTKSQLLKILLPVALVVVVVIGVVAYKFLSPSSSSAASKKPLNKDDASVVQLTEDSGAFEIHQWFQENPLRMTTEYSKKQALFTADMLQGMGAKKVLVFGGMMSRVIAIELPDNLDQRAKLIAWENRFAHDHAYPGAKEEGQKYLLLQLGA
jgi:hypothetical protein